jgi:hypothetical protein
MPAQVAEQSEIVGGVNPDTQDWVIEMAIPWVNMIGDFNADLAKGDSDGNGRNVFPPLFGDVVGFVAFGIDVDSDTAYSFFYCTHDSFPWEGAGLGELRFVAPIGGLGSASRPSPSVGTLSFLLSVFQDFLIRMVLFRAQLTIGELMKSMTLTRTVHGKAMSGALVFLPRQHTFPILPMVPSL